MNDPITIDEAAIEDRSSDALRRAHARLKAATTGPELEALAQLGARQQRRWGSFALTALRRLGEWLNRAPRAARGRPKNVQLDIIPTYEDLGITDRHLAAWSLKVAAVPKAVFDAYLKSDEGITRAGLLAYAEETAASSVFPKTTERNAQARSGVGSSYSVNDLRILEGDCAIRLRELATASVDLIVTSPPYADQRRRAYGGIHPDKYVEWFMPIAAQLHRVLKPTGSFILNIKEGVVAAERSTYVLELILAMRKAGWLWTEEFIWHKKNAVPGKWPNRFRDAWERCLHFTKQTKISMYQDAVMVPVGDWVDDRLTKLSKTDIIRTPSRTGSNFARNISNWLGRDLVYPTNVLYAATECGSPDHSAPFPEDLPEFFIKLFTADRDLVLDPFLGSGTTLRVAGRLNRRGIGIEIVPAHCEQARRELGLRQAA